MKIRNVTEKLRVEASVPPGVILSFRPGEVRDVDAGFAYLAENPAFEVIEPDAPAKPPDEGGGKGDGKKGKKGKEE